VRKAILSSDITVDLIKHSASDMDVVMAAWVSTKGENSNIDGSTIDGSKVSGLIGYLMRERHGSPFEHSTMTFYIKAPIFVMREHMRHRAGFSYNEESGRYKILSPEFYVPSLERKLVQVGKTGAYTFEHGSKGQYVIALNSMRRTCNDAYEAYEFMLENGIAKEVARMVLPVSIYSSAYVTMNARSLMNFLSLRQNVEGSHFPSYPQREIEMVAEGYERHFAELMPITYEAFMSNGRVSP
jgi:thymidylate synthase (FAD)